MTSAAHTTAPGLERDIASFGRHLRAANLSPKTVRTYLEATDQLARFLAATGRPATLEGLRREALEAFMANLLARHSPATAHNRYAGLQALLRWPTEELIAVSSMAASRAVQDCSARRAGPHRGRPWRSPSSPLSDGR